MRDGALKSLGAHATAQDAARAYARECSVAHGGRPDERASARGAQVPGFHAHSLGPAANLTVAPSPTTPAAAFGGRCLGIVSTWLADGYPAGLNAPEFEEGAGERDYNVNLGAAGKGSKL